MSGQVRTVPATGMRSLLMLGVLLGIPPVAAAQESVTVSLPGTVSFTVATVNTSTTGTPAPTRVTFSNAFLLPLKVLRFSVKADASSFTGSGGTPIPATKVTWTVSNASGGNGSGGQLSAGGYTQVFQSSQLTGSGEFDVTWTLGAPGTGTAAGTHTLVLRWRIESVSP